MYKKNEIKKHTECKTLPGPIHPTLGMFFPVEFEDGSFGVIMKPKGKDFEPLCKLPDGKDKAYPTLEEAVGVLHNKVARQCGIDVPEFRLMDGKYFAVKRFDIENDVRLHVLTVSALLNEPISPPKMDYHSLLQLTGYLTQSPKAVEQQFRRMAFNVYAHNMDDHARNFSFICREGTWSLAPAYDLTNDDTLGEHATTINFKGLPTDEDLITVGTNIRISRARCLQILEEVRAGTKELRKYLITK